MSYDMNSYRWYKALPFPLIAAIAIFAKNCARQVEHAKKTSPPTYRQSYQSTSGHNYRVPTIRTPSTSLKDVVKTVSIAGVDTKFHWCPPGTFMMGSPTSEKDRDDDETQHEVRLTKGFWLCKVPVTVAAFRKFVNATGYKTEAEKAGDDDTWRDPGFEQTPSHPVVLVSWNDAQAYIKWLNENYAPSGMEFKLPTEAHWEYACRAGSHTAYWWGDDPKGGKGKANVADASLKKEYPGWPTFSFDDGYIYTSPVGSFDANAWGLKDMTGNVYEWCSDWYGDYPNEAATDPTGTKNGSDRVLRGGGWNYTSRNCRSASRNRYTPGYRYFNLGFRLELIDASMQSSSDSSRIRESVGRPRLKRG